MKALVSVENTEENDDASRWQALANRTATSGAFCYAVKTTGIFCRPNCRSRLPHRANVLFFATATEALAAGFRPCKRCQPAAQPVEHDLASKLSRACRVLETDGNSVSVESLAKTVGLSPSHFHRLFKRGLGVTPRAYQSMHRLNRFRHELRRQGTVTSAVYEAGFGSTSRAYERVSAKLGMTPRQYLGGGQAVSISFALTKTSLGWLLIALSERGVCAIQLGGSAEKLRHNLERTFPQAELKEHRALLKCYLNRIRAYLKTTEVGLHLPLDIRGTAFQRRVWRALQEIPPGHTRTYQAIARGIGHVKAVRAVAGACAANKLALAVPCHRVVRQDGTLGGFRWGSSRKRALLHLEASGLKKRS